MSKSLDLALCPPIPWVTLSEPTLPLPNTQDTQRGPGSVRALLTQCCLCLGLCPSLTGVPRDFYPFPFALTPREEPEWFSGGKIQPPLAETRWGHKCPGLMAFDGGP